MEGAVKSLDWSDGAVPLFYAGKIEEIDNKNFTVSEKIC